MGNGPSKSKLLEEAEREKGRAEHKELTAKREELRTAAREREIADQIHQEQIKEKKMNEDAEEAKFQQELNDRREHVRKSFPGKSQRCKKKRIVFPEVLKIGLFGSTGVGKTSLINSVRYAVDGYLDTQEWLQVSASCFHGGHTLRRQEQRLTDHLIFVDNRGIGSEDMQTAEAESEIIAQLDGKSKMSAIVNWKTANQSTDSVLEETRINCTVLVFDARMGREAFSTFHSFIKILFDCQGRYPIGVITNIDRADLDQLKGARTILQSLGITDIYEVKNLNENYTHLDRKYQLVLLKMIERCMFQGDEIIQLRHDKTQD